LVKRQLRRLGLLHGPYLIVDPRIVIVLLGK